MRDNLGFDRYQQDPVGFCRDVLGVKPWGKQIEILEGLRDRRRVTVRSCNGAGKSFVAACACLYRLHCFDPSIVITTAPAHRQVRDVIWREIRRLQNRAKVGLPGEVRETQIKIAEDKFALGFATNEEDRFQGFHKPHITIIVEEASGVEASIFEAIEGCLTGEDPKILLIGNPLRPVGRYYDSHRKGSWHRVHISALDSPNLKQCGMPIDAGVGWRPSDPSAVTLDDLLWPEPAYPELIGPRDVVEMGEEFGWESPVFLARALGEFPDHGEDQLIPLSWVEEATKKYLVWKEGRQASKSELEGAPIGDGIPKAPSEGALSQASASFAEGPAVPPAPSAPLEFGVDVARYGGCENAVVIRQGAVVLKTSTWRGLDLMATTGRIAGLVDEWQPRVVRIDVVGMGGGVYDRLRELQRLGDFPHEKVCRLVEVVSQQRATKERYHSRRDEAYFRVRTLLKEGDLLFADEKLAGQLTELRYGFTSSGQLHVESKDDMRSRGVPSPDRADALTLAYWPEGAGASPVLLARAGQAREGVRGLAGKGVGQGRGGGPKTLLCQPLEVK